MDAADRSVTIYSVAQRAGVSISTVSRVIRGNVAVSDATRDRVLQAISDLRYVPSAAASNLATRRQPTLGLVLPHLEGEYYASLLIGFELAAADLGYSVAVLLANSRADIRTTVRSLAERVDGLAFLARSAAGDDLVRELAGPRAVVTLARASVPGVHGIASRNRETATVLVDHLLDTGRRDILFVGTPFAASDVAERHAGYRDALDARSVARRPPLEVGLTEEAGVEAAERVLDDGAPVDALVCGNDLVALAAMRRLQAAGVRLPDDVAITGWDDIHAARYVTPALTTVDQQVEALGRVAAHALHDSLTGTSRAAGDGEDPQLTVLDTQVVHRESCCSTDARHAHHHTE